METQFLWVVKNSRSKHLSRSSKAEEAKIRHHVQRRRLTVLPDRHRDERLLISPDPSGLELNCTEKRSLDFFVRKTAPEWSGWQDGHFWNTLVLQTCHQDSAIVHGLVAIAAWHESSLISPGSCSAARIQQFTLLQYSKAFSLGCAAKELSYTTSLISCVILASLQSYRGDYQIYRLLRSGSAMIEEIDISEGPCPTHSARSLINNSIRHLLERLQARFCSMGDQVAALANSVQQHVAQHRPRRHLPLVPVTFKTLRAARDCLEGILTWAHDYVLASKSCVTTSEFFHSLLFERIERWGVSLDDSHLLLPSLLHIAALNGLILLSALNTSEETAFDVHVPTFRRIMDFASHLRSTKHPQTSVTFGIDSGLIDIIAFTGTRCRDPSIRRRALSWLQQSSRYEGERLSSDSAAIVHAWIGLEEAGKQVRAASDIPENARRRLVAGERYHAAKRLKLIFATSPYDANSCAKLDVVWLDDANATAADGFGRGNGLPDVIFAPCHAAFLDDRERGKYHNVHTKEFYFPIPKV